MFITIIKIIITIRHYRSFKPFSMFLSTENMYRFICRPEGLKQKRCSIDSSRLKIAAIFQKIGKKSQPIRIK